MIKELDKDFSSLNEYIGQLKPSKIFILVDENTHDHCLPILLPNLETDIPFEIIEIEAGEENKNLATATQLWEIFAEMGGDRKSLLINLGGGVVSDMGGFVASTYKRGFKFINIPTTLLAMCDASIGGKTGIDHQYLKNIIGTFALPEHIFLYPKFLETLKFEELRSGFAEMLKHGLIADADHWTKLSSLDQISAEGLAPFIHRSMEIKNEVVTKDFKEENVRKILNFGHTIGHAVESLFLQKGNLIPHGEAVALGMICETHLAFLAGLIDVEQSSSIISTIQKFFPYIDISEFENEEILKLMVNDKKNEGGNINFSLINGYGTCLFDQKLQPNQIKLALDFYKKLNKP
ncbi:3-dehydroquinate synthase [Chryseobacterium sp. SC28]|uniref:3-dehydroquinate synthase n=1 Tax=Chryseobacterium sp. SC28 TaxID=2268028 RepID=UPI000F652648|nr:3-dehydroquinate synthase [Chryseobacterium sp. SC28]RRQ45114.1 3-dehydroquinate synthase [Chryseobacterium sp. SC28]